MTVSTLSTRLAFRATLAAVIASTALASPPVRLHLLPREGLEGGGLRVTATIEPNTDNQGWCLVLDNEVNFYRRSCEAEISWRIKTFQFDNLPAGRYQIALVVIRADGSTREVHDTACFRGGDEHCGDE